MLMALTDLTAYQTSHSLTNDDLLNIGDVDLSGRVNNADLQAELKLLITGVGSGATTVPEPPTLAMLALGAVVCGFAARGRHCIARPAFGNRTLV